LHCELVRTQTSDGLRLDGALLEPTAAPSTGISVDAAICLHGVGANFYTSSTLEGVAPALRELGLHVLLANTRGHDTVFTASVAMGRRRQGAAYETVDDCRLDVAGWLKRLAERGLTRVLLVGHSLGAIKSIYAQALERFDSVAGIVALSPPRLSHRAFMNSLESSPYFDSLATAEELVRDGKPQELFQAKFPFPLLITAAGYIEKYGPAERYNILQYVPQLPCPALFVYGSRELEGSISFAGMPDALRSLPGDAPREIAVIPDADHNYTGVQPALATTVGEWVVKTFGTGT
jgi:pimeloyl-ACP methyl ester carboxylesterase